MNKTNPLGPERKRSAAGQTDSGPSRDAASLEVARGLEVAIHEHRIAPGTKLGEDEIGEIYSVSRTVIRAALRSLAHQQLVEIKHNRGAFVAQPSLREAQEVFEARELLEPRTAELAAMKADAKGVARLRAHIEAEHRAMEAGEGGRALRLSGQFHVEIAHIAEQTTIAGIIEALIARSSLIIALYWRRESALCERFAHHALVEAIEARNAEQAHGLMRSHLIDLHSALDLSGQPSRVRTLREALLGDD